MQDKFNYNIQINENDWEIITTKGIKKYLIKGYFSTIDEDLSNETVTMEAQKDILNQVKDRTITLDAEHEIYYDEQGNPKNKPSSPIPIGKVVDAELTDKGVYGTVELNPDSPRFKNIWNSIKKGFVHSFSVAFYPMEAIKKKVNGVIKSFVNRLNLINITLTGNPMNPNATFTPVMKSAAHGLFDSFGEEVIEKANYPWDKCMSDMIKKYGSKEKAAKICAAIKNRTITHKSEVNTMVEDKEQVQEPKVDESKVEKLKAEQKKSVEQVQDKVSEPTVDIKSITASIEATLKSALDLKLKSINEEITKTNNDLKAELKTLGEKLEKLENQPIHKAIKTDTSKIAGVGDIKNFEVREMIV